MKPLKLPPPDHRPPYCYWRPSAGFIDELSTYLSGKRVLEVFAGNGLLAAHLAARGIDVVATTTYSGHDGHHDGFYHPVENLSAVSAVSKHVDVVDVLLMCWPTVTRDALLAARRWGGDVVYIGEVTDYSKNHLGGCADDEFFEQMKWSREFAQYRTTNPMEKAMVGKW